MLQICRAEDGQVFQVNAGVRDIERIGSLELFLHQETGVDQDAVLAYLPDGRRLTNSNIRELNGSQTQSIYVFNKYYLDLPLDDVLRELRVEAPLQPPIEDSIAATPPFRPSQLGASYLRTAHVHKEHITHILSTLHSQHDALRIASTSLDMHVLAIVDTFESVAAGSRRELEKQAALLSGLEADLDIISRVRIHTEFVSPAVRKAIESGDKARTLGDYVSNVKMKQVADTCARTHEDLRGRFIQTEQAVTLLQQGTDSVRSTIIETSLLDDGEASSRRAQEIWEKISHGAAVLEGHVPDPDGVLQELRQHDFALRQELQFISNVKNAYTQQCIGALRSISVLNNDMIQIPPTLANLQASFRGKNSFSHIQRLHNMLYAYGATVIEIVRRKEFGGWFIGLSVVGAILTILLARFFYQRAQSILEVMAKLSASERKRRQVHRGEVHGQLPFETRGMDDPREDVDGLLHVLDDLENASRAANDLVALAAVRECRAALDRLVVKMDSLESGFDRIAERSLLSASRLSTSRRRSTEADEQAFHELSEQLREAQESRNHQDSLHQEERYGLQTQIHRLQTSAREAELNTTAERERAERLERELQQVRAQMEGELGTRRIVEERNAQLGGELDVQRRELAGAVADAAEQGRVAEGLRQELEQVRTDFEDVKALEARNAEKIAHLLEDQADHLRILEEARSRGENLEVQIQAARSESEKVDQALKEARREKDRLLRAQATEHERVIRDHIAEADGDRAVLERQFHELKAVQEHTVRQLEGLKSGDGRCERGLAWAEGGGLKRLERELREARHAERVLREDLRAGRASQSDFEQRLENSGRLVAQILDVALAFRSAHVKALNAAQLMASHPGTGGPARSNTGMAESGFSSSMRHSIISHLDEPSPIDPSDPATALEALRAFDHDHFLEAITKTGSTIRKWQKQCKEYRERAKAKISFRNFAKGDLALFLPTRNSVSKPWAAFNGGSSVPLSFPHYFLQATGHLAEQLKTREWIVARITSITERVVDHNDPTSNPYGLGDGVKYYMLEVEDWTQPSQQNKRRVSSRKVSKEQPQSALLDPATPALPSGPPEADVEDSFLTTHSPNLHLFPVRSRSTSSPPVRPSSLSRLLAQAPPESQLEPIPSPPNKSPSPPISPPPPASPSHHTGSIPQHVPVLSSPLRPASRASRISTTSRFSVGRIPALGSASSGSPGAKAPPTTALAEQLILSSSPSSGGEANPFGSPSTPSPDDSMAEGVSNVLRHSRRRTSSYHVPRTSPLAPTSVSESTSTSTVHAGPTKPTTTASNTLANLASSWGVSFGRKKKAENTATLASTAENGGQFGGS
ncbi:putative peripheral membrane protein [Mycena olivaceomarginata]|nr:putative peripheral membrane protein [Mycena olivaceomarginata]